MLRLKELRAELGYHQSEVAEKLGISLLAYIKYERGISQPSKKTLAQMADFFDVSVDYLLGKPTPETDLGRMCYLEDITYMKVIDKLTIGKSGALKEKYELETTLIPTRFLTEGEEKFFVLRVHGTAMHPKLLDGDFALTRRGEKAENGAIAVVIYGDNEAMIRKIEYAEGQNRIDLIPENPEYETQHLEGAETEKLRIVGQVYQLLRSFEDR